MFPLWVLELLLSFYFFLDIYIKILQFFPVCQNVLMLFNSRYCNWKNPKTKPKIKNECISFFEKNTCLIKAMEILFLSFIFYITQIIENLNQSLETYSVWMVDQFRFDLGQERLYQTAYLLLDQWRGAIL